jgi:GTP-binding protein
MSISSATFVKSVVGEDEILENGIPQVAFIGRSNVGKSSVINSLVGQKNLARSSSLPGLTKVINVFLVSKSLYFIDLPGYGFAQVSKTLKKGFQSLTDWYLFESDHDQKKVVLIIDAKVGPTDKDLDMLKKLEAARKDIVVVANKMDKLKSAESVTQLRKIQSAIGSHLVIPYSAEKRTGVGVLANEIFK